MSSSKKMLGLVGFPLSHSFSKEYFTTKFVKLGLENSYQYKNFELKNIVELSDVIARYNSLIGFNVTIPHKEKIVDFVDELDEFAKATGAVNTVSIKRNKLGEVINLKGYNTDVIGFKQSIKPFLEPHHQKALVLGSGGASKAVQYVLQSFNIPFWVVTREKKNNVAYEQLLYSELNEHIINACTFVINTSAVGMFPSINDFPIIPYSGITSRHLVVDLFYNPEQTEFLKRAKEQGAQTLNGLNMLHMQAEAAWQIWEGKV